MNGHVSLVSRLRAVFEQRVVIRPRKRAAEPYATHVPILVGLGHLMPVRRVLELGGGRYSTPLFLRQDAFPLLTALTVVESDPDWFPLVRDSTSGDSRAEVHLVPSPSDFIKQLDLSRFDLIFIDDSSVPEDRAATIQTIASSDPTGLVVIHDFDVAVYRKAARRLGKPIVFREYTPQTAIFQARRADRSRMRTIRATLRSSAGNDGCDVDSWVSSFRPSARSIKDA